MVNQMVDQAGPRQSEALDTAALDEVYAVLSSERRREIVRRLTVGPAPIAELREGLGFTKQAMTKHVRRLEAAGLVRRSSTGRAHVLTLERQPIDDAIDWLERTRTAWTTTFDALEDYLT